MRQGAFATVIVVYLIFSCMQGCKPRNSKWRLRRASAPIPIPLPGDVQSVDVTSYEKVSWHPLTTGDAKDSLDILRTNVQDPEVLGEGPVPQFGRPAWVIKITEKAGATLFIGVFPDGTELSNSTAPFSIPTHDADTFHLPRESEGKRLKLILKKYAPQ